MDVENEKDWKTFIQRAAVKKIKLEVQVDLADVEKRCRQVCSTISVPIYINDCLFFL